VSVAVDVTDAADGATERIARSLPVELEEDAAVEARVQARVIQRSVADQEVVVPVAVAIARAVDGHAEDRVRDPGVGVQRLTRRAGDDVDRARQGTAVHGGADQHVSVSVSIDVAREAGRRSEDLVRRAHQVLVDRVRQSSEREGDDGEADHPTSSWRTGRARQCRCHTSSSREG